MGMEFNRDRTEVSSREVEKSRHENLERTKIERTRIGKELDANNKIGEVKEGESKLSVKEREEIKAKTGWSDEIVGYFNSKKEAEIYEKADLQEKDVEGRKCLIKKDIDADQKDEFGRRNKKRMEEGHPPLNREGERLELHHIGQKNKGPLAELTMNEHRGKGNDGILHDKKRESEIDRNEFTKERKEHWKDRALDM